MHKLFIFMRSDLDSLNPGKAMAQAAHAANQFWFNCVSGEAQQEWLDQAKYFGTTIVLDADNYSWSLHDLKNLFTASEGEFGVVHDPTYPVKDGMTTHLIPLDTCAYLFDHGQLQPSERTILETFRLYK